MEILEKVEKLKAELDAQRPLDPDVEKRVWQKLRLDWNYHSNKIEGNTYSYGETKMLLMKGLTAGGKPVRDHEEITGHNQAIDFVLDYVSEDQLLTEVFIRHLHQTILVRPFWSDAKTSDGQPTKKLIKVGEYKTEPNHVETQSGDIFYFAEPFETPAKMYEMVEWFRTKVDSPDTNPIVLATELHYRFVRIHPFDDGNGRMARLLLNYVLIKYGYPPVIVKNEDKNDYIAVLEQSDFGILVPFVNYIAGNLMSSLQLTIDAAKGISIDEPDDLDKELVLLEKRMSARLNPVEGYKTTESVERVYDVSIVPLIEAFLSMCRKFDRFYRDSVFQGHVMQYRRTSPLIVSSEELLMSKTRWFDRHLVNIRLSYSHEGLGQNQIFDHMTSLTMDFGEKTYRVTFKDRVLEKSYSESLTPDEISQLTKEVAEFHKKFIDSKISESESRVRPES